VWKPRLASAGAAVPRPGEAARAGGGQGARGSAAVTCSSLGLIGFWCYAERQFEISRDQEEAERSRLFYFLKCRINIALQW